MKKNSEKEKKPPGAPFYPKRVPYSASSSKDPEDQADAPRPQSRSSTSSSAKGTMHTSLQLCKMAGGQRIREDFALPMHRRLPPQI